MKNFRFLGLATFFLASLTTGQGQDLSVTLSQPTRNAQQGDFVTFPGTIRNNGASELFLNGNSILVSLHGSVILPTAFDLYLDDSPFTAGVPPTLGPGQEWSGDLFRVKVGLDAAATTYDGSFSVLGGTGAIPFDPLASAEFHLNVLGPAPVAGPAAPGNLKVRANGSNLVLEWIDQANNEEGFSIEQSTNGGAFAVVGLVGADRTYFTAGPLNSATNYFFRVRAFNGFNTLTYSAFSNVAFGRTVQPKPPAVLPWNAGGWAYMNPMGGASVVLPPRPADGTADPDFNTTWFLSEQDFIAQYDGPTFGATPALTGTPGNATTYDSGVSAGPLGYPIGGMDYFATAGAEFTSFGTVLTNPLNGQRRTSYYRRTFTVPSGGLTSPTFRYLIDDSAYFYLDGVLVATVNVAPDSGNPSQPVADVFTGLAPAPGNEASIETLNLSGSPGLVAGTNNARIWISVPSLAAGTHTLAVSVHNASGSGDSCLALEISAPPPSQIVYIGPSDSSAQVATSDTGAIVIGRSGDLSGPLAVTFEAASGPGQAVRGTRYALDPDSLTATFAAGQQSTTIMVNPLADTAVLGTESVTLNLLAGVGYFVGAPPSATVQLLDSPINVWKIQQFGSLAAAQGPEAADDAAPAGDGITNLMKYSLGLNPLTPSVELLPVVDLEDFGGSTHLTLTFSRPVPVPPDISYHVEWIEDLADVMWEPAELVPGYPILSGGSEILKFRDPEPSAGKTEDFIRLRVTRP